ncbi:hypothetical protein BHE74_00038428 [Ensete ventricosum]|uniref:Uncharacterized protein n=1 Tax=Ensete ventricosum TaxID=4639 RepID=A0A444DY92_ENSVE|nr:hypothetical protein B296_00010610 [Ensete ventricosum]RWW03110.1 hypothetical protein GW17_00033755 [Ensete ventricosum]RWW54969.1 hypothetical protein BHE74_00038428 [Ensete ventricosum]RZR97998.1 hypothetical protein BHM03_00027285 [Ensete ventricosum]
MKSIHIACEDAVNCMPSRRPIIEMTIPSILDRTISRPGMIYIVCCVIWLL